MDNGSCIDGESTTGDVGRGGRRQAILCDEFASVEEGGRVLSATRDNTHCRLFNSTPNGTGNAFYDLIEKGTIKKLRLHWTVHPIKNVGMYKSVDNIVEKIDEAYWREHSGDYPFVLDGKVRSPWYDNECDRSLHPAEIAKELDINYHGSDFQFFDGTVMDRLLLECREPYITGELHWDTETYEVLDFHEDEHGRFRLWINYDDATTELPDDRSFILGVDIASGTGASNSVISVADKKSGERVAEFVSCNIQPHELAQIATVMGRWFKGSGTEALMIWEANGPGRNFGDPIVDLYCYGNIFLRRKEDSLSKQTTNIPGWWSGRESKLSLLGEYRRALSDGDFINRSHAAIRECSFYRYAANGTVVHAKATNTTDADGARDNHADRVIADSLCWLGMKQVSVKKVTKPETPRGSFLHRREQAYAGANMEKPWW